MLKSDQSKHCIRSRFHGYAKICSRDPTRATHARCEIGEGAVLSDFLQSILIIWRDVRLRKESVVKEEKTAGGCREGEKAFVCAES